MYLLRVTYEPLIGEMSEEDKAEIERKYTKYINEFYKDVKKSKEGNDLYNQLM